MNKLFNNFIQTLDNKGLIRFNCSHFLTKNNSKQPFFTILLIKQHCASLKFALIYCIFAN
jgi:hypothetical protein